MTIQLKQPIQIAGIHQPIGTMLTLGIAAEAELFNRGAAVYVGANPAVGGTIPAESGAPYFYGRGVSRSRIGTRIFNLNTSPTNVGAGLTAGTGILTFHAMTDLEAQVDAVRFVYANYKTTSVEVIAGARCCFAAAPQAAGTAQTADATFSGGGSTQITFNGAATASIPVATVDADFINTPSFVQSDWIKLASLDRTDNPGHNRPLLHHRVAVSGLVEATGQYNAIQPCSNATDWSTSGTYGYPDITGRWLQANRNNGGNTLATAFGQTPAIGGNSGPLLGIQYRCRSGFVFTIAAFGDSITAGAGSFNSAAHNGRTWLLQTQRALSTAGTPVEFILAGYSGKHTYGYGNQAWNLFTNTDIRPSLALFAPYTPNSGPTSVASMRSDAIAFAALCESKGILPGFWSGLPSDFTTDTYATNYDPTKSNYTQANDALRVAYNTSLTGLGVPFVSDFNATLAISGLDSAGTGTAQVFNDAYTIGAGGAGLHPSYAGDTALANKLTSDLRQRVFQEYWLQLEPPL